MADRWWEGKLEMRLNRGREREAIWLEILRYVLSGFERLKGLCNQITTFLSMISCTEDSHLSPSSLSLLQSSTGTLVAFSIYQASQSGAHLPSGVLTTNERSGFAALSFESRKLLRGIFCLLLLDLPCSEVALPQSLFCTSTKHIVRELASSKCQERMPAT